MTINTATANPVAAAAEVERGMALIEVQSFTEARAAFEHAIDLDPNNAAAWNGVGRVHYNIGTPAESIAAYERSIALDPSDVHPYYGIGVLLSSQVGDYAGAIAAFERGLAALPDNALLAASIASTYARMGEIDEAVRRLEAIRAHDPNDRFAQGWLSLLYLHLGRYDDAIDAAERNVALGQGQDGHRMLGYAYALIGETGKAIAHFEAALALAPGDYEVAGALARQHRAAGRVGEAEALYRNAREQAVADGEYGLACLASVSGETDEALDLLEVALAKGQLQRGWARIDPEFAFIKGEPRFKALTGTESAAALVEDGMAHFHAGRYDDAQTAFDRALALDPNCGPAWHGIGWLRERTSTADEAIAAYERAIAVDPRYAAPYYGIGMVHAFMRGDYARARAAFQRGLEISQGEARFINQIGSTYARMGRFDDATATLRHALVLDPSNTHALGWLGMLSLRQGRYDDAIALYQRQIAAEPAHYAHRVLGYALELAGRRDEAIAHLERAVAMEPKDYEARAALARVYRAAGRAQEADEHERIARSEAYADNEYGQACFESVMGNADGAVSLLRTALDKRQERPGWARIDPEFVFISDDPRFQALVGE